MQHLSLKRLRGGGHHQELATFLLYQHIGHVFLFRCVLEIRYGWVGVVSMWQAEAQPVVLQPATWIPPQPSHTETPTRIETRTHDQCVDIIEKLQAPDDECINVRNMLSVEEVK